ncbi:MAG: type II secretion system F family protein [Bacilli bacterium]|nr:type II secretion system F family protein [Bacilli bacterium]
MKKVLMFPITILKYAKKGVGYLFGGGAKTANAPKVKKLDGVALDQELARVKRESTEFNREEEIAQQEVVMPKLQSFRYVVRGSNGNIVKGIFDAENEEAVRIFLTNEGLEIISIKARSKWDADISIGGGKVKKGDLSFSLTQLATYIKAGIPLIDSMRILARQTSKASLKRIYDRVVYELVVGCSFSTALERQGDAFPRLLINMVKTSEMTGDLAGTLEEMADYYTETERSRKQMLSALIYPAVILTVAIGAVVFIIMFVVPQFVDMFASNNAELPWITEFVIKMSDFLASYWWALALGIFTVLMVYHWSFKNVRAFRKQMQTFYMKLPIIGNVIIYNEVSNLTRTFASLLSHSVFITDSMEILSQISSNEVYKEIINRTLIGLSKGAKISETFRGEWAFPVVAYEMLVTGESTGQLALMMEKVADHYQALHSNAVTTIKSLIEPIIICFLAVAVGFIIMSIILPMFDLYGQL